MEGGWYGLGEIHGESGVGGVNKITTSKVDSGLVGLLKRVSYERDSL